MIRHVAYKKVGETISRLVALFERSWTLGSTKGAAFSRGKFFEGQEARKWHESVDEIHTAAGRGSWSIVRTHLEASEMQVYLAGDESLHPHVAEAAKAAGAFKGVPEAEVTWL